ncbi:MAG: tetraacyldisaccharide 4'-kinase [Parasulfuritortus sp.]|nr:tetraacyldisaccharide 4'-kinase [Parasulfuritortus sp.]
MPFSLVFAATSWLRRRFYVWGWLGRTRMPVPVIVVGNLTAGGTGKTPLAIWLVEMLRAQGYRPGIVSRGYGVRTARVRAVEPSGDPSLVGDEPVLLARRTRCPVWVGRNRVEAATSLLAQHPDVDVIVADDGLQHYALDRDVEIIVVDGQRRFGNGWCIPAGPLREGLDRLRQVDAVVVNGNGSLVEAAGPVYNMTLAGVQFTRLNHPGRVVLADYFSDRQVHALAGIGNPERFFANLADMGLNVIRHAFPDHHIFRQEDLPGGTLVMTEKDAVKCVAYTHPDAWVFTVDAQVSGGLERLILNKLESRNGSQTA